MEGKEGRISRSSGFMAERSRTGVQGALTVARKLVLAPSVISLFGEVCTDAGRRGLSQARLWEHKGWHPGTLFCKGAWQHLHGCRELRGDLVIDQRDFQGLIQILKNQ